ncbi:MAG: c-type cytochrome, partial [Desulfuromonadaceae bacterium]
MDRLAKGLLFALLSTVMVVAAGCSGGGGPSSGAGAAPAAAKEVTGVAATGAPIVQGAVFLKDSSDTPKELQQSTRSDGSFTFDVTGLKPPFFLKVAGTTQNLYSIATDAGMTNITPLTTIVVAYAAQRSDLDTLYGTYNPADIRAIAQKMSDSDRAVQTVFAPLMSAFGVEGSLVYGPFVANHTGLDALMDAVSVSIASGMITVTQKGNNAMMLNVAASQLGDAVISMSSGIPTMPASPTSGSALYTSKCAGCHGDSANSNLSGRVSVLSVQNAIATNRGGMGMLSGLSAADIQAVVDHLTPVTSIPAPTPTPTPVPSPATPIDGAALYAGECAGCHGSLATSSKKGMTAVRLQNAIGGNIGGMGFLSALTDAEIQALVTVLNPVETVLTPTPTPTPVPTPEPTPVPDGAALYSANCAGCHGSLSSSSKQGITIARL